MALVVSTSNNISAQDPSKGINIIQSKSTSDTGSVNIANDTYTLAPAMANYQEVTKADIATVRNVFINVADSTEPFAGLAIGFGATEPTDPSLTISKHISFSGNYDTKLWVKNLDQTNGCTLVVVLAGTNS